MALSNSGALRERLVLQQRTPPATVSIASITRTSTTATVMTASPHGYATGDYVTVAGAVPTGYNGKFRITVTSALVFTYTVSALSTPATGTMTVMYESDSQGGRATGWRTLDTVPAELVPMRVSERLQLQAMQSLIDYRFRVRVRNDLSSKMRALWTPRWPPGSAQQTLEIHGVIPMDDGRRYVFLEAGAMA